MVNAGSSPSHQLSGASGSLSSSKILHKGNERPGFPSENGQHYSLNLHQQNGGSPLTPAVLSSTRDMELKHREEQLDNGRISSRGEEHGSGLRVPNCQGQV